MYELVEKRVYCPYCGEGIDVLIDNSIPEQRYTEDCQVCCRPIIFDVVVSGGNVFVTPQREDE